MSLTTDPAKKLVIDLDAVPKAAQETCFIPSSANLVEDIQGIGAGEDFTVTVTKVDASVELASGDELRKQIANYQSDTKFDPEDSGPMGLPGAMAAIGVTMGCAAVIGIDNAERSIRQRRAAG